MRRVGKLFRNGEKFYVWVCDQDDRYHLSTTQDVWPSRFACTAHPGEARAS